MAPWEDGGGPVPLPRGDESSHRPYIAGGTRRVSQSEGSDYTNSAWTSNPAPYLPIRLVPATVPTRPLANLDFEPIVSLAEGQANKGPFFIRTCTTSPRSDPGQHTEYDDATPFDRQPESWTLAGASPVPVMDLTSVPMERTASGVSISSGTSHGSFSYTDLDHTGPPLLSDMEAALQVRHHLEVFTRRQRDSQHERILRTLINPKSPAAEFPIDDAALGSIFSAANEIFFKNVLSQRVRWDWSHESARQYETQVIGTTALRRSATLGGFETLIVLSQPILGKDGGYHRRLLISTFLHELIHSYMFVMCGFEARRCGGHTEGFRMIAEMIDDWAGPEYLHLKEMEADLERFRERPVVALEQEWERMIVDRTRHHTFYVLDECHRHQPLSEWTFPSQQSHHPAPSLLHQPADVQVDRQDDLHCPLSTHNTHNRRHLTEHRLEPPPENDLFLPRQHQRGGWEHVVDDRWVGDETWLDEEGDVIIIERPRIHRDMNASSSSYVFYPGTS